MTWQPIETAPEDGTNILLACDGEAVTGHYDTEWNTWIDWRGTDYCFEVWGGDLNPTHWMPLPPAPGAEMTHLPYDYSRCFVTPENTDCPLAHRCQRLSCDRVLYGLNSIRALVDRIDRKVPALTADREAQPKMRPARKRVERDRALQAGLRDGRYPPQYTALWGCIRAAYSLPPCHSP